MSLPFRASRTLVSLACVCPTALLAQVRMSLPGVGGPVLSAGVGPWSVSAGVGASGVDVRVGSRTARVSRRIPLPRGGSTRVPTSRTGTRTSSARASRVLALADDYVGTPYVWGGTTPHGFDCSGFVQYVFARHGVELPRTSRQQAKVGRGLSRSLASLRAGDLLMFASRGSRIDHVAIYAGDGRIIHSTKSGRGVRYDDLYSKRGRWYVTHHVVSRRVIADGKSLVAPLRGWLALQLTPDAPDLAPPR